MSLFKILKDQKLTKVERKNFSNEEELHKFTENNLSYLTGIRFIANEYPIPNGRIDTLGIDEDNVPVIIEYKWKKDLSAIVQGLFYLDWVMQNKKPFESIVKDKLRTNVKVNWSTQPRLIIIAQDFDIKELAAINQMGPSVELKKYSLYGDLFNIEDVNIVKKKVTPKPGNGEPTVMIEQIAKKANPEISELFYLLRSKILGISDEVWEKVGSNYCDYRTSSTFASVNIQKKRLKIFIKMGEKKINDSKKITKPIPSSFGYGFLNTQFDMDKQDQIEYAMFLIKQAYDYLSQ